MPFRVSRVSRTEVQRLRRDFLWAVAKIETVLSPDGGALTGSDPLPPGDQ
jgi:hypothetical protein